MRRKYYDKCWQGGHVKGCRPARPRCKWMRKKRENRKVCECEGYHFPHRRGSGCCIHSKDYVRKQWERNTGTPWEG